MATAQPRKMATPSTLKTRAPVEVLPLRQVQVLLSWQSPTRVFKKRGREFWSTLFSIAFLLGVILFFIKEWLLIIVIIAAIFVFYVLSNVPPENIEHQVTTRGVRTAGRSYLWEEFTQFWISQRNGQKILNLEMIAQVPGRLELLLGSQDEKKVKEIVSKYLPEEEAPASFLDRSASWLSEKIPLESS